MKNLAIGVDVGGSHVGTALLNQSGEIILQAETSLDPTLEPSIIINDYIIPTIKKVMSGHEEQVAGIGLGLPGSLDIKTGLAIFLPNFGWRNIPVKQPLHDFFNLPVFILNDVNVAALGEWYWGKARGERNFILIAMGTGIGGGLVSDGRLLLGEDGSAGEIGHITVMPENGPQCGCGSCGCLESIASGKAMAKRYAELERRVGVDLREDSLTTLDIYNQAKKGDPLALQVFAETGKYFGIGLAILVNVLNPHKIILGGRVAQAGEFFLPQARAEMKKRVKMIDSDRVEICSAQFEESAGIMGAGVLTFLNLGLLPGSPLE